MAVNMGLIDRALRLMLAGALAYAAFGGRWLGDGALMWAAVVVAAIAGLTAIVGNCPLYSVLGMRTCRVRR